MNRQRGFTLIELILTVVVVAIVAMAASNTLLLGFQSYSTSIDRQDTQMQAKFVIEKFSRELRHAVPNSIDASNGGECVSFVSIEASAFYLSLPLVGEDSIDTVIMSTNFLDLDNTRLTINPSTQKDLIEASSLRYVSVNSVAMSAGVSTINFSSNNNPAFISNSTSERAFFYQPEVIEYCIQDNGVYRSRINAFGDRVSKVQLANQVSSGKFEFESASMHRNSTVRMVLAFTNGLDEVTQYQHDVQVMNVP